MSYYNNNTWDQKQTKFSSAFEMGNKAENEFAKILKDKYNITTRHGTTIEDKSHKDFFFEVNGKECSCDVKAMKKLTRDDLEADKDHVYVELLNQHGYCGWLYGSQNYMAFENVDGFYLVRTDELRKLVEMRIDMNSIPHKTSSLKFKNRKDIANKRYYRCDPKGDGTNNNYSYDLMCILSFNDIKSITRKIFYK